MLYTFPYRIFAVDPATGKSGWSVLDVVSLVPLRIKIVATGQIDGDKLLRQHKEMAKLYIRQFIIPDLLFLEYQRLITEYKPNIVVSESAFGYTHMNALISLTLAIHELRRASKQVLAQDIVTVPPTITKKAFTGTGGADKDLMRLAYQTNEYLEGTVADELITEHEIDSIGHGVGFIRRDIIKDVEQVSAKDKKRLKLEKKKAKEVAIG